MSSASFANRSASSGAATAARSRANSTMMSASTSIALIRRQRSIASLRCRSDSSHSPDRVAEDQTGQQAQAEWVIAIGRARGLDVYTCSADALRVVQIHRVRGMDLKQFFFATPVDVDLA